MSGEQNVEFVEQLRRDYPGIRFKAGRKFLWRAPRTIMYVEQKNDESAAPAWRLRLLHELGHALLEHVNYEYDVERVKMECAAWEKARELAEKYGVEFDEDLAQNELNSYRDWMHQRSKCPNCGLTRFQEKGGKYCCPGCEV